jgi:uncharacterized membrane protein
MTDSIEPIAKERGKPRGSVGPRSFRGRLFAGVLLIIPLAVTAFLMKYVYEVLLFFGVHIVYWTSMAAVWMTGADTGVIEINIKDPKWYEITLAIGMTIMLLYLLGWLGSNVVGQRIIEAVEHLFERIPMVDKIYGSMRKMVQAMSSDGKDKKQRVVLVDFPHQDMKALAFLTNVIADRDTGQQLATVYLPTTPNPTSGYMEVVPIERLTYTDWTVDEAISIILSGGATAPPTVRFDPPIQWGPNTDTPTSSPPRPRDTEP